MNLVKAYQLLDMDFVKLNIQLRLARKNEDFEQKISETIIYHWSKNVHKQPIFIVLQTTVSVQSINT